jgi:hypothetical protein
MANPKTLNSPLLYSRLKLKYQSSQKLLAEKHPNAFLFFQNKQLPPGEIRKHATNLLTSGVLASSLLLSSPKITPLLDQPFKKVVFESSLQLNQSMAKEIKLLLPNKIEALSPEQETQISHLLFKYFGIHAVPQLGSTKLNHVYGLIGAEQHLPRYPGDNISQHDEFQKSGITPGRGAWGYFAPSKEQLTPDLILKEKYYVAVQTLYLSDWNTNFKFLRDWYKYRKVVVVNPVNGKTITAVIADAGPAWWTGKHFGGSPEVMAYLELNTGKQKGPVVLYFVDDPENRISLGPLEYNLERNLLAKK